jgi:hypothetical protein
MNFVGRTGVIFLDIIKSRHGATYENDEESNCSLNMNETLEIRDTDIFLHKPVEDQDRPGTQLTNNFFPIFQATPDLLKWILD